MVYLWRFGVLAWWIDLEYLTFAADLVGSGTYGANLTPDMKRKVNLNGLPRPLASNKFSNILRRLIEKTKYKKIIAVNMALLATVFNVATLPSHAFDYQATDRSSVDATQIQPSTTESIYQFPIAHPTGISQWYGAFHPGIDIRAPRGTQITAVAAGMVIEVKYTLVGYGHYVRIAHAGTVSSLYAHMDRVDVKVGQTVEKGQELGTVGLTGWTTGPHLHFELNEGIKTINPKLALTFN